MFANSVSQARELYTAGGFVGRPINRDWIEVRRESCSTTQRKFIAQCCRAWYPSYLLDVYSIASNPFRILLRHAPLLTVSPAIETWRKRRLLQLFHIKSDCPTSDASWIYNTFICCSDSMHVAQNFQRFENENKLNCSRFSQQLPRIF